LLGRIGKERRATAGEGSRRDCVWKVYASVSTQQSGGHMTRPLTLAAAAVAAALLAGCGSSGSSSSSTAASTPASTPTQSTAASTSAAAATPGAPVATKKSKLGTILAAGPKHLTVYLFEADKGTSSSCSGACAKAWPPVTTAGQPTVSGAAVSADLGTTTRQDGTKQVTYKGHPLYFFEKDEDSGDAYGQGSKAFGAGWYVMKANGSKVDDDEDSGGKDSASKS
jgi:predicted lipoprotein with Yx(FWY)xxD motif